MAGHVTARLIGAPLNGFVTDCRHVGYARNGFLMAGIKTGTQVAQYGGGIVISMDCETPTGSAGKLLTVIKHLGPLMFRPCLADNPKRDRGRLGTEDTPVGCARDGRTSGTCVALDIRGGTTCTPTSLRARRASSPRVVPGSFRKRFPQRAGSFHDLSRGRRHSLPKSEPMVITGATP